MAYHTPYIEEQYLDRWDLAFLIRDILVNHPKGLTDTALETMLTGSGIVYRRQDLPAAIEMLPLLRN